MRRLSRDTRLTLAVFGTLALLWGLVAVREYRNAGMPALSAFSDAPNGGRALALWLEEMGYDVRRPRQPAFAVPAEADVALLLAPAIAIGEEEIRQLNAWVAEGRTLIVAGDSFTFLRYVAALELELRLLTGEAPAQAVTPLLAPWSGDEPLAVNTGAYFDVGREDAVTLVASGDRPVVVTFPQGAGRIVASATVAPLTNEQLRQGAPLLQGVLDAFAAPGATIWFDEWHHGLQAASPEAGPLVWLRQSAVGRSILFLLLLTGAVLLINGRRLGRPVQPATERRRRSPLEFVDAMASLNRRAGHRQAVQRQLHRRLKRELGAPYHVDPSLADDKFVARMARMDARVDSEELATLLARLRHPLGERELVRAASAAHEFLNRGHGVAGVRPRRPQDPM